MSTLLRRSYFSVQHHRASAYVQVIRSEEPFAHVGLVEQAFAECDSVLCELDRSATGILLDFRRAPMSTDPELHRELVARGDVLIAPFGRSAVLVSTRVGVMQTERVNRTYSKGGLRIYYDENAAVRYVTGGA